MRYRPLVCRRALRAYCRVSLANFGQNTRLITDTLAPTTEPTLPVQRPALSLISINLERAHLRYTTRTCDRRIPRRRVRRTKRLRSAGTRVHPVLCAERHTAVVEHDTSVARVVVAQLQLQTIRALLEPRIN